MRHYSTRQMIEQLSGLLDTDDLNEFETGFVANLKRCAENEKLTSLTERQMDALENLFNKHFA